MAFSPKLRCPRCGGALKDCGGCKGPIHFRVLIEATTTEVGHQLPDFTLSTQQIGRFASIHPDRQQLAVTLAALELWRAPSIVQVVIEGPDAFWPRFDAKVAPRCGNCGQPNSPDSAFCENCGQRLQLMLEVRAAPDQSGPIASAATEVGLTASVGPDRVLLHGAGPSIGVFAEQIERLRLDARWMPCSPWELSEPVAFDLGPGALTPEPTPGLELDYGGSGLGEGVPDGGLPPAIRPEPEPAPPAAPELDVAELDGEASSAARVRRRAPAAAETASGAHQAKPKKTAPAISPNLMFLLLAALVGGGVYFYVSANSEPSARAVTAPRAKAEQRARGTTGFSLTVRRFGRDITARVESEAIATAGTVVTAAGHIVTVARSLGKGDRFTARFFGLEEAVVMKVVARDKRYDLALLAPVEPIEEVPYAELSSTAELPPRSMVMVGGEPGSQLEMVAKGRSGAAPKWRDGALHLWLGVKELPSTSMGAPVLTSEGLVVGIATRRQVAEGLESLVIFSEHILSAGGVLAGIVPPMTPGARYQELRGAGPTDDERTADVVDTLHSGYYEWRRRSGKSACAGVSGRWAGPCAKDLFVMVERITETPKSYRGALSLECKTRDDAWKAVHSTPKVAWKKAIRRRMALGQDRSVMAKVHNAVALGKLVTLSTTNARFSGTKLARFVSNQGLRDARCRVVQGDHRSSPFKITAH